MLKSLAVNLFFDAVSIKPALLDLIQFKLPPGMKIRSGHLDVTKVFSW